MYRIKPYALILAFFLLAGTTRAQEAKYKAIQGLGYLHTQVSLIINNWEVHPLNHTPMDEFEKEWQDHLLEELKHDEEWAEYMMVEENIFFHFEDFIDLETEEAINTNLKFYHEVINALRDPEDFDAHLDRWMKELAIADGRLYNTIYPSLCH